MRCFVLLCALFSTACTQEHGDINPEGVGLDWCACTVHGSASVEPDAALVAAFAAQTATLPTAATFSPVLDPFFTDGRGPTSNDPSYLGPSFVATFDWDQLSDVRAWHSAAPWADSPVVSWPDDMFVQASVPVSVSGDDFDADGTVDLWIVRDRTLEPSFGWRAEMAAPAELTDRFMARLLDVKPYLGAQSGVSLTLVQRDGVWTAADATDAPALDYQVDLASQEGLYTVAESGGLDVLGQ